METSFEILKGDSISSIEGLEVGSESVRFKMKSGKSYRMYHFNDCCETVSIEDIAGDLEDIIDSPILLAELSTSNKNPEGVVPEYQDSFTWSFYKIATIKGSVTIRWYGSSNGYYSESVYFSEVNQDD